MGSAVPLSPLLNPSAPSALHPGWVGTRDKEEIGTGCAYWEKRGWDWRTGHCGGPGSLRAAAAAWGSLSCEDHSPSGQCCIRRKGFIRVTLHSLPCALLTGSSSSKLLHTLQFNTAQGDMLNTTSKAYATRWWPMYKWSTLYSWSLQNIFIISM